MRAVRVLLRLPEHPVEAGGFGGVRVPGGPAHSWGDRLVGEKHTLGMLPTGPEVGGRSWW